MKTNTQQWHLVCLFLLFGLIAGSRDTLAYGEANTVREAPLAFEISGRVTSDKGEALPGVSVVLKGTTIGASTDTRGRFTLSVPDNQANGTLVVSYIGFTSQEVAINGRNSVDFVLRPDIASLNEVVVVGYGTQNRESVTGAVSQIQATDIARTTATTATGALVGKMQGITARQGDARPGAGTNIQIRNMGNPLYVIDNVVSDAGQFNNLDVNDIETVSILKDASAAVYGLEGANGVILVTTKRGKAGQAPRINLNGYYGISDFTRYPRPGNAYQHQLGRVEATQNQGQPPFISAEELEKWKIGAPGYETNDYYDFVMKAKVPQYYMNASASGGSESTTYHFSLGHTSQDALIKDYHFKRTNVQANIETTLAKGLKVGTQIYGRVEDRYSIGVPGLDDYFNPFLSIFTMWPTEKAYANDNPNYVNSVHNVNVNPATYTKDVTGYVQEYWRGAKANLYAQYDFKFGLSVRATYSYNFSNFDLNGFEYTYNAYRYDPATDTYNVSGGNQNPWRQREKRNIIQTFSQINATYNKRFGDHEIGLVAAGENRESDEHRMVVHTVPPNNYIPIMLFANQDFLTDQIIQSAQAGLVGRVNYNYKQKYLLEVLGRYDGSYLFAPGKRFGLFPGVSVGYRISEEPFMKNAVGNVLNDMKIRASYGQTGSIWNNTSPAPFAYLGGSTWNSGSAVFDGNFYAGVRPRGLPITNISWVTNTTKNIGVDFKVLNKLSGSFDVFERERTGIPDSRYDVLLPSEVGYTLPLENLNSDAHRGVEGILTYADNVGQIGYSVAVHGTLSRRYDIAMRYKPRWGNSWHEYRDTWAERWASVNWGYQVVGQFQSQEEVDTHPVNVDGQGNRTLLPGDFIYKDVNGDGIINTLDQRPIGYQEGANPYMSFGMNTGVTYKGLSLMVDFAGASMQTLTRNWELKIPYQNDGTAPDYVFADHWRRQDPYNSDSPWIAGTYPAMRHNPGSHSNYAKHSDFWLINVRYLRVRNLELGYNLPQSITSRVGMSGLRVYFNGTNLFSIDNVKQFGIDPEISAGNGLIYPPQRLYTLGFNLSF